MFSAELWEAKMGGSSVFKGTLFGLRTTERKPPFLKASLFDRHFLQPARCGPLGPQFEGSNYVGPSI